MDARIMIYDFKKEADPRGTYSALECLKTRGLDCKSLWRWSAVDLDNPQVLKTPLAMDSIPHFLVNFATFVLPIVAATNPQFRVPLLLM